MAEILSNKNNREFKDFQLQRVSGLEALTLTNLERNRDILLVEADYTKLAHKATIDHVIQSGTDGSLNDTSISPVQNKEIKGYLNNQLYTSAIDFLCDEKGNVLPDQSIVLTSGTEDTIWSLDDISKETFNISLRETTGEQITINSNDLGICPIPLKNLATPLEEVYSLGSSTIAEKNLFTQKDFIKWTQGKNNTEKGIFLSRLLVKIRGSFTQVSSNNNPCSINISFSVGSTNRHYKKDLNKTTSQISLLVSDIVSDVSQLSNFRIYLSGPGTNKITINECSIYDLTPLFKSNLFIAKSDSNQVNFIENYIECVPYNATFIIGGPCKNLIAYQENNNWKAGSTITITSNEDNLSGEEAVNFKIKTLSGTQTLDHCLYKNLSPTTQFYSNHTFYGRFKGASCVSSSINLVLFNINTNENGIPLSGNKSFLIKRTTEPTGTKALGITCTAADVDVSLNCLQGAVLLDLSQSGWLAQLELLGISDKQAWLDNVLDNVTYYEENIPFPKPEFLEITTSHTTTNSSRYTNKYKISFVSKNHFAALSSNDLNGYDLYDINSIYGKGVNNLKELNIYGNTSLKGNINASGEISASSFNATSSIVFKENVVPTEYSGLDIVNDVSIVDFNYKNDDSKVKHIGFIAEDTHKILSGPKHDHMDYTNCIGILLKAVQELSKKVEILEEKVKEYGGRI